MKKTDLEKLKGKKLDARTGRLGTSNKFGAATTAAKGRRTPGTGDTSLVGKLLRQALEKK